MNDQAKTGGVPVTVQAATSITDTTGQADKLNGLAGQDFSCFVVNPISGTNLIQGAGAARRARRRPIVNIDSPIDAKAAKAAERHAGDLHRHRQRRRPARRPASGWPSCCPPAARSRPIGGISGDVTSGARIEGFTKGLGSNLKRRPDGRGELGPAEGPDRRPPTSCAPTPTLAGFFVANDDMGLGVARAVANAGKTGKVEDHQRRRHQGRPRRRSRPATLDARRGAVPVRDRPAWASRPARPPRRARPCPPTSRPRWHWSPRTTPTRRSPPRPKPFGSLRRPVQGPAQVTASPQATHRDRGKEHLPSTAWRPAG